MEVCKNAMIKESALATMANFTIVFSVLLSGIVLVASCKKDTVPVNQNENLLTRQSWVVTSIRQNTNNNGWVDIFSALPACKKDNKTYFNPDHSINLEVGLTKCDSSEQQSVAYGTWSLSADAKQMSTTTNFGLRSDVTISLLDNYSFVTIRNYISGTDTTVTETKYTH